VGRPQTGDSRTPARRVLELLSLARAPCFALILSAEADRSSCQDLVIAPRPKQRPFGRCRAVSDLKQFRCGSRRSGAFRNHAFFDGDGPCWWRFQLEPEGVSGAPPSASHLVAMPRATQLTFPWGKLGSCAEAPPDAMSHPMLTERERDVYYGLCRLCSEKNGCNGWTHPC